MNMLKSRAGRHARELRHDFGRSGCRSCIYLFYLYDTRKLRFFCCYRPFVSPRDARARVAGRPPPLLLDVTCGDLFVVVGSDGRVGTRAATYAASELKFWEYTVRCVCVCLCVCVCFSRRAACMDLFWLPPFVNRVSSARLAAVGNVFSLTPECYFLSGKQNSCYVKSLYDLAIAHMNGEGAWTLNCYVFTVHQYSVRLLSTPPRCWGRSSSSLFARPRHLVANYNHAGGKRVDVYEMHLLELGRVERLRNVSNALPRTAHEQALQAGLTKTSSRFAAFSCACCI